MNENKINEDNCVLDGFELSMIKLAFDEYTENFDLISKKLKNAYLKITQLNEMAKEKQETKKIGLLGKDADAIVFSEYSIGKEFKEKGK